MMTNDCAVLGIDGCRGRWFVAWSAAGDDDVRLDLVATFRDVLALAPGPRIVAVDMPIGLAERGAKGGREAERAVRAVLGKRRSSVFAVPSRQAMMQTDYSEARRVALATSDPPRSMSKQTFCIAPYIREIDAILRADNAFAAQVYETHPEVAFRMMKGSPLDEPKKKKHRIWQAGMDDRRSLLLANGIPSIAVSGMSLKGVGEDDRLDALAALVVARRIRDGDARSFPETPPRDAFGLPMAIWA